MDLRGTLVGFWLLALGFGRRSSRLDSFAEKTLGARRRLPTRRLDNQCQ